MFSINKKDKSFHITRGDIADIEISAELEDKTPYVFKVGDIIRFQVSKRKDTQTIELRKDVIVEAENKVITVSLTSEDTKIGEPINKPVDYWYSIELNPDTRQQTLVGFDEEGEKIFRLYPEGCDDI